METLLSKTELESQISRETMQSKTLNLTNLLIDFFQIITEKNTLIIQVDDIQWLNSASKTSLMMATSYISKNLITIATSRKRI